MLHLSYLSVSCWHHFSRQFTHFIDLIYFILYGFYTGILYMAIILQNPRWLTDLDAFATSPIQWNRSQTVYCIVAFASAPITVWSVLDVQCSGRVLYIVAWWHVEDLWRSKKRLDVISFATRCQCLREAARFSWCSISLSQVHDSNLATWFFMFFFENRQLGGCKPSLQLNYSTSVPTVHVQSWGLKSTVASHSSHDCYELAVLAFSHGRKRLMTPPVKSDKHSAVQWPSSMQWSLFKPNLDGIHGISRCLPTRLCHHPLVFVNHIISIGTDIYEANFATRVPVV